MYTVLITELMIDSNKSYVIHMYDVCHVFILKCNTLKK